MLYYHNCTLLNLFEYVFILLVNAWPTHVQHMLRCVCFPSRMMFADCQTCFRIIKWDVSKTSQFVCILPPKVPPIDFKFSLGFLLFTSSPFLCLLFSSILPLLYLTNYLTNTTSLQIEQYEVPTRHSSWHCSLCFEF